MTLVEVLQTYLHTRQQLREDLAERKLVMADQMELQALLAGLKLPEATRLVSHLRDAAKQLRKAELSDTTASVLERDDLTDAQRAFFQVGREQPA